MKNLFTTILSFFNKFDITRGDIHYSWKNNTRVSLEGDTVIRETDDDSQHFDLNTLQYIYLYRNESEALADILYLCLNEEMFIHSASEGFAKVYRMLSGRLGFDDSVFFTCLNNKKPIKLVLWRKKQQTNYTLLNGHDDYALGFEIQAPQKQFIRWGVTYEELARNPHLQFDNDPYRTATFTYPVRFGNLLLNGLTHRFNWPRQDAPITCLIGYCYHDSLTDISYQQIKHELMRSASSFTLLEEENAPFIEGTFYFDDIALEITYFYGSQLSAERGYTLFKAMNQRHSQHLIDSPDENALVVSDYLIIKEPIGIMRDHPKQTYVRRRPLEISRQFRDDSVIWRDDVNQKIGIAVDDYSLIFDLNDIAYFPLGNAYSSKGSGSSTLGVITQDKQGAADYHTFKHNDVCIVHNEFGFFNRYADRIEQLTGKKVIPMDPGFR